MIPGNHQIKVTLQKYWSSEDLPIMAKAGEMVALECGPGTATIVTTFFRRRRYLRITFDPSTSSEPRT